MSMSKKEMEEMDPMDALAAYLDAEQHDDSELSDAEIIAAIPSADEMDDLNLDEEDKNTLGLESETPEFSTIEDALKNLINEEDNDSIENFFKNFQTKPTKIERMEKDIFKVNVKKNNPVDEFEEDKEKSHTIMKIMTPKNNKKEKKEIAEMTDQEFLEFYKVQFYSAKKETLEERKTDEEFKKQVFNRILEILVKPNCPFTFFPSVREWSQAQNIALLRALTHNRTVYRIGCGYPNLGLTFFQELIKLLEINTCIKELIFNHSSINDETCTLLTNALANNTSITSLEMQCKVFKLETVISIANMLKTNTRLTSLNFSHLSSFGNEFCQSLAEALLCNPNSELSNLMLSYSGITSEGCLALVQALKVNTKIKSLDLTGNYLLGPEGGQALLDLLLVNTNIQELRVFSCKIPSDIMIKIEAQVKYNSDLAKNERENQRCAFMMGFHRTRGTQSAITTAFGKNAMFDRKLVKELFFMAGFPQDKDFIAHHQRQMLEKAKQEQEAKEEQEPQEAEKTQNKANGQGSQEGHSSKPVKR